MAGTSHTHSSPVTDPPDRSVARSVAVRAARRLAAFLASTLTWLVLFVFFLVVYPPSWGHGSIQAVPAAGAWCLSTLVGSAVFAVAAGARTAVVGGRLGLALGFIVAGGGLLYSVTGHRPANSDAWPTDLLIWAIALTLAMASGWIGGWAAGAALARRD